MPKPKKTLRSVQMNIAMPEDLAAKIQLELYSDLEGKIPFGAQSEFFAMLVRDYFSTTVEEVVFNEPN